MSSVTQEFANHLTKVAKEKSQKSYLRQMSILAPAAAVQASFDIPRGIIDKSIESRIAKTPKKKRTSSLRTGMGRGAGRFGAALVTTPMFLSGIKQLKNAKTKKDRNEGLLKVIGSGAAYSTIKGGIEGGITRGLNRKALSKIKDLATVRGGLGMGAAALTGLGIARLKKQDAKLKRKGIKKSKSQKMLESAATGFGVGALKGGLEGLYMNRKNIKPYIKTPRKLIGAAVGRGAAGAAGATLLSEIADKYMSKVSSVLTGKFTEPLLSIEDGLMSPRTLSDDRLVSLVQALQKQEEENYKVRSVLYKSIDEMKRRKLKNIPTSSTRGKTTEEGFRLESLLGLTPLALEPLTSAQLRLTNKEMKPADKKYYNKIIEKIEEQGAASVDLNTHAPLANRPDIGAYDIGKNTIIVGGKSPNEILLHELGHAQDYAKIKGRDPLHTKHLRLHRFYKNQLASRAGAFASVVAPLANFDYENLTEKELQEAKKLSVISGVAGLGLNAPKLLEEAVANKNAIDTIKRITQETGEKSLPKILKYIRKVALPQSTYLIPQLVSAAGYGVLSRQEKKLKKKKENRNESRK